MVYKLLLKFIICLVATTFPTTAQLLVDLLSIFSLSTLLHFQHEMTLGTCCAIEVYILTASLLPKSFELTLTLQHKLPHPLSQHATGHATCSASQLFNWSTVCESYRYTISQSTQMNNDKRWACHMCQIHITNH